MKNAKNKSKNGRKILIFCNKYTTIIIQGRCRKLSGNTNVNKSVKVKDEKRMSERVLSNTGIRITNSQRTSNTIRRTRRCAKSRNDDLARIIKSPIRCNATSKEERNKMRLSLFAGLAGKTAENLISYFKLDESFPVDLERVLTYYNIDLYPRDFSDIKEAWAIAKMGPVSSMVEVSKKRISIFYQENNTEQKKRFAIAYELAKCCLYPKKMVFGNNLTYEQELEELTYQNEKAYLFACSLLIPQSIVDSVYDAMDCPDINVFAKELDVPKKVMEVRLKHLNKKYTDISNKTDIFASELLIPAKELRKILSVEYPDTLPHVTKLAEMFAVSVNVMKERLIQLEIPYIDEYGRKNYAWSSL